MDVYAVLVRAAIHRQAHIAQRIFNRNRLRAVQLAQFKGAHINYGAERTGGHGITAEIAHIQIQRDGLCRNVSGKGNVSHHGGDIQLVKSKAPGRGNGQGEMRLRVVAQVIVGRRFVGDPHLFFPGKGQPVCADILAEQFCLGHGVACLDCNGAVIHNHRHILRPGACKARLHRCEAASRFGGVFCGGGFRQRRVPACFCLRFFVCKAGRHRHTFRCRAGLCQSQHQHRQHHDKCRGHKDD